VATRRKIEVFYDGECPLCRRSRSWCEVRDRRALLDFRDIQRCADDELPTTRIELDAAMWVRDSEGGLYRGFEAWRRILAELEGWRWLALLSSAPPLRWLGPPIYAMIARWRRHLPFDRGEELSHR
jgi:predicted DCC family thiol-disulfide oxidoreductase YuxK